MEFYNKLFYPEEKVQVEIDPVHFLSTKITSGIWMENRRTPFAVNYGDNRKVNGRGPFRAFKVGDEGYIVDSDEKILTQAAKERNFFYDVDKIIERVVMVGEPSELLDAFFESGYRMLGR